MMAAATVGIMGRPTDRGGTVVAARPRHRRCSPMQSKPIPRGYCQCGCGGKTTVPRESNAHHDRVKGEPLRFIRGHNSSGVDRSRPRKLVRYVEEDRGFKTPCWIWQLAMTDVGYGTMSHRGVDVLAHRFHFEQERGAIPPGLQIDHLCRVRECVNPEHMEAVTPAVNSRRRSSSKLTEAMVIEIRRLADEGESNAAIARKFGVSRSHVSQINSGLVWRDGR